MSKPILGPMPVVEWSSKHAIAVTPSGTSASGENVQQAAHKAGLPRAVVLALSRRSAFVRTTNVPNVSEKEVGKVLELQIGKLFPIAQGKVAYAFSLGTETTAEGVLASVVATPAETLKAAKEELASAGLHAAACIPSAMGAVALASSLNIKDCAVVELGIEGLSIDILKDGMLRYSRVAPRTTDPEAIKDEVCRTYSSVGIACGPIVAAGGLTMPSAEYTTGTSTLEALAKVGLGLGVNVELPEEVAQREARLVGNRVRLAGLLCLAALVLATMVYLDRSDAYAAVAKDEAKYAASIRKERLIRDEASKKANAAKTISDKVRRVFEPGQKASDIMVAIGNLAPKGAWVTNLTYDRGKLIQIRGTAVNNETVTAYLQALTAQDRFRDVKLVVANNALIEETEVVNFSISLWAVGNLPIEEPKKKGAKK